jgi:hypothetical protein
MVFGVTVEGVTMSLRLIKPGLSVTTGIFHPSIIDPRTGSFLEALGVTKRGPVWPVMGGAEEDDEEEEKDDEEKDDDTSSDDSEEKDDVEGLKARIKALQEEKDRHYKRRTDAEKELDELRAFKKSKEREGLSDEDKAKRDKEEKDAEKAKHDNELSALRREKAFLLANDISWHDREVALSQIDWEQVEVSGDGTVDGKSLKAELKRLAKAKPYLVKSQSAKDEADDDDSASGKSSASDMNGKRKGRKPPTKEELAKRFPALGRN